MSDEDKQVARKILEERFGMPLEKLPVHKQPSAYAEMREIACKARLATAEAALDEALKREEEFAGYHNELVSDQAEKIEALSEQVTQQAATIEQMREALKILDRVIVELYPGHVEPDDEHLEEYRAVWSAVMDARALASIPQETA